MLASIDLIFILGHLCFNICEWYYKDQIVPSQKQQTSAAPRITYCIISKLLWVPKLQCQVILRAPREKSHEGSSIEKSPVSPELKKYSLEWS